MANAARDRLARTLRGEAKAAFSAELTSQPGDLSLDVEGFGRVKLPVTPAKARKLIGLGQPAQFGRGEETLTDPDVRDTWEIPRHLVRAGWDHATLTDVLATVKEELGLPNTARLTADLHSLLVYEPPVLPPPPGLGEVRRHDRDTSCDAAVQLHRRRASCLAQRRAEGLPGLKDGAVARRLLC